MNNRTIKLRIWDIKNRKYTNETSENFNGEILLDLNGKIRVADYPLGNGDNSANSVFDSVENQDNYIIQQFTGLLDKNGKEIYEGDILKYEGKINNRYWGNLVVRYITDWASFKLETLDKNPLALDMSGGFTEKTTIIDNIFENPELLKTNTNGDRWENEGGAIK